MLENVIKEWGGKEVTPMELYTEVFRLGEGYVQKDGEAPGEFKANPIGYWKNDKAKHGHYRVLFEDTFEEILKELQEADFGLLNGITYFGRKRDMNHASKMYAMIFDMDDIDEQTLLNFFSGSVRAEMYPMPNYMVLSGSNLHLYYLFEEPIELYPYMKIQLKSFKYALTERICNPLTTHVENVEKQQKQGIFQPFRVVGGKTKPGSKEARLRAFQTNTHPYSLEGLSRYVPEAYRVDEGKLFKERRCSLEQAKKKYPEWYEKVIVKNDRTVKKWDIQGKVNGKNPTALYDWWVGLLEEGASFHHRYFGIMCLAIYGAKVSVPYEKVREDAYRLMPLLNNLKPDKPFTEDDIESALECYDDKYCTFPIKDIEAISGIKIPKNKRNGRKRDVHVKIMNSTRDVLYPNGEWRNKDGRPKGSGTKKVQVRDWQVAHPDGTKTECHKETGLSRVTINKWWMQGADIMENEKKEVLKNDYWVTLPDGSEIVIEYESKEDLLKEQERLMKYAEQMRKRGLTSGNN